MKKASRIFTIVALIFLYVPMIVLILGAFNGNKTLFRFENFTFDNFVRLFHDSSLIGLLANSVIIAIISALVSTIIGTIACLGIHALGKRTKRIVMAITNIPMTNPDIVTGVSLALLFAFVGNVLRVNNILSFWTLLIAHITFNLPYVILAVLPKLSQMDPNLREAAMDLGCPPLKAFFKVVIHELMPGIISGMLLAFTMSLDDFVISYFVTGSEFVTLPIHIYSLTKKPVDQKIYALFTIMFAVLLVGMILMAIVQSRDDKKRAKRKF